MHAFIGGAPEAPHAGHGDHQAATGTLSLCVIILAGGGMLALAGIGPARTGGRPRHRSLAWSRVHIAAPLLPRRRPVTWCVLRV
jgi:hypothetical protein